jgi:IS5 family transposase
MLVDRYGPQDLFTQIPGRCLHFEPVLAHLARRAPHTRTRGRHSTPVEVLLRMLVVMRLDHGSFAQTEYFVNDSLVLRQFCRLDWQPVPDDTPLIRWAGLIGPATLEALNARVIQLARQARITRGRKLRVDTTVVATNIHPPADSSLLTDGVRVLGRLCKRAQTVLGAAAAWRPRQRHRAAPACHGSTPYRQRAEVATQCAGVSRRDLPPAAGVGHD